ncbi:unnamed protein product [Adineta ricciae]|uniref:5'-nucleotidase n=1 Tax=Adineta ricciae TaxID=249248 RepID=A0A815T376_ADIRI|nr:unnamed protein product [Adineta ricciae]CAF1499987.1 unnamed protein product [Adineta ricciae]
MLWLNCNIKSIVKVSCNSSTSNVSMTFAVENGIIDFPPVLPNDGKYVQWIFLQTNDVYELLPLNKGENGGLARVAHIRDLLLKENPNTIAILAGDLVSPSALGTVKINGTTLHGKQMISTMNALGLDYMTFGNHEFDLTEEELLTRMNESAFTWISSNVFRVDTSLPFGLSVSHKIITIDGVKILLIGLTINETVGYVRIVDQLSLSSYTKQFLTSFANDTYDVVVAIIHLDLQTDIDIATSIPQIDLILGGHEHENSYNLRGTKLVPIAKADSNAFTVYIHRCAFNLGTKQRRTYSTLAKVSSQVAEQEKTATTANYWFNLGVKGLQLLGYEPLQTVSCLPDGVQLDGRYQSVTTSNTLLTEAICESLIKATEPFATTVGLLNGGTIAQYDILRTLPFPNTVVALAVPSQILAQVLTDGMSAKDIGLFIDYTGVQTPDQGSTWLINGVNINTDDLTYRVATTDYLRNNTKLNSTLVTFLKQTDQTQTKIFIDYMKIKYPC